MDLFRAPARNCAPVERNGCGVVDARNEPVVRVHLRNEQVRIREAELKVAALARRRTGSDWQQLELGGKWRGVLESSGQS